MIKLFHRLFNPHCDHCAQEARDEKICPTCEVYRSQLELANYDKKKLLETIERMSNPPVEEREPIREVNPIPPRNVPWRVRAQILESESRAAAEKLRAKADEIKPDDTDKLEKEVGL